MHRSLFALAFIALAATSHAAYTTPGTGVRWDCDDLVAQSAGAVTGSGSAYQVHETVIVAVGDTLEVTSTTLTFEDFSGQFELDIHGALVARNAVFTSAAGEPGDWYGIRFRDTDAASLLDVENCTIEYGRYGVDVVYHDILLTGTTIRYTLEKAVDLTGSGGEIRDCRLEDNRRQTIYMTLGSSPVIENCELRRNNLDNSSPYPYINIGLQGVNSPTIRGCYLEGGQHMSGGIAVWNACQGVIENTTIRDCGYGILCYSTGANPTIRGNSIVDNNLHPDAVNWGFGIACNGDNQPVIENNLVRGHWYGIAITGGAEPDLGREFPGPGQSSGRNRLLENGLGAEVYAIFNNTSNPIMAEQNWYGDAVETLADVEDVIWHGADDPTLGPVDYDPSWFDLITVGAGDLAPALELYGVAPNPFNPRTLVAFSLGEAAPVELVVHDLRGRRVRTLRTATLAVGRHELLFDGRGDRGEALPSGTYLYRLRAGSTVAAGRMQLVR